MQVVIPREQAARTPVLQPVILRALFALSVLGFAVGRAGYRYVQTSMPMGGDTWMVGDWLINYGGGFVRRGLFGQLFLTFAPAGQPGLWILFALQMSCYLLIFGYGVRVLYRTRFSWSSIALICGPAGLAFIGWVPSVDAAFRKELIGLAALALLALARPARTTAAAVVLTLAGSLMFLLGVFSWEATALLLPVAWYLLLDHRGTPAARLVVLRRSVAAVVTVVSGFGALLSMLFHGDVAVADAICDSVRAHGFSGPQVCSGGALMNGGAIEAIGWTSYKTAQDLAIAIPPYIGFIPLIVLALLPVVASAWFRRHWRWALLAVVAIAPLYFIVTDYGRWTHVLVLALTFCVTADDPAGGHARFWNPVGSVAYTALWGMPHWMGEAQLGEQWWPSVGLLPTVLDAVNERLGALTAAGSSPTSAIGAALDFGYIGHFLKGVPAHGWDSWFPVMLAMRHMDAGGANLYETLFFGQGVKFQYATTSLLFIEPFWALWPDNIAWPLNALGWLAVAGTGYYVFRIAQHMLGDARPFGGLGVVQNSLLLGVSMTASLTFYPLVQAWELGQAQTFINFFCTLSLFLFLRRRTALSGFFLALACLLKPQLALFVLWGLVRREWRFVAGIAATGAVGVIAAVVRYGWHNFFAYFDVLSFLSRRGESFYINHSVNGLLHHLLNTQDPLDFWGFPAFNPIVYTGTMVSTVVFVGLALVVVARPLTAVRDSAALDFSIGLVCFTVSSPIAWEHHYGLILPVYAVTLILATRLPRRVGTPVLGFLALSYLMTGFSWYWQVGLAHTPANFLLSLLFFGVLVLLGCMLVVRWHLARGTVAVPQAGAAPLPRRSAPQPV